MHSPSPSPSPSLSFSLSLSFFLSLSLSLALSLSLPLSVLALSLSLLVFHDQMQFCHILLSNFYRQMAAQKSRRHMNVKKDLNLHFILGGALYFTLLNLKVRVGAISSRPVISLGAIFGLDLWPFFKIRIIL